MAEGPCCGGGGSKCKETTIYYFFVLKCLWFIFLGSGEGEGELMSRWRAYVMVEGNMFLRF